MILCCSLSLWRRRWHQMEDENLAQKRQHLPRVVRIVYNRVCPKFQFQKNFNLQLVFFKFYYVSSFASSSSSVRSTAAVTQPEPQTTKTPTDGRGADGRTIQTCGGGTKNLELAGRGRPTLLGSAYYDVKQGSPKLGRVGLDCKS